MLGGVEPAREMLLKPIETDCLEEIGAFLKWGGKRKNRTLPAASHGGVFCL